jgi:hypothetical protein
MIVSSFYAFQIFYPSHPPSFDHLVICDEECILYNTTVKKLTQLRGVLPEKLIVAYLVQKFAAFADHKYSSLKLTDKYFEV